MDSSKPTRLLYKLLAGLIYTDIELRPKHELEAYATAICATDRSQGSGFLVEEQKHLKA